MRYHLMKFALWTSSLFLLLSSSLIMSLTLIPYFFELLNCLTSSCFYHSLPNICRAYRDAVFIQNCLEFCGNFFVTLYFIIRLYCSYEFRQIIDTCQLT